MTQRLFTTSMFGTARRLVASTLISLVAVSCGGGDSTGPLGVVSIRFVTQPTSVAAGQTFEVTVELINKNNGRVTTATDMVTLSLGGGVTLNGTTSVAAVGGLATFSGLTVTHAGSNLQFTATAPGFSSTGGSLAVTPAAISAQLSTVTLNPATLTLNVASQATFTFRDAYSNPLGGIAVNLSSTLAGVTFTPSSGTTNPDGTFTTSVRATSAGSATLSASVGGISINIGSPMTIGIVAVGLRFVTQPVTGIAGQTMTVAAEFFDGSGNRLTTATNQVTLTASGGVALTGATSVPAVAGLATFTGIGATTAATGVILTATGGGFTVLSSAFNITAGPPALAQSTLTFATTPNVGVPITGTFTIKDAFSNVIGAAPIALTSSLAGTTFNPPSGTTTATGGFTSAVNAGAAGAGTITATVNGTALAFPVTPIVPVPCSIGALTIGTIVNGSVALENNGCALLGHAAATYRFTVPPSATSTVVGFTAVGTGSFLPQLALSTNPTLTTGGIAFNGPAATPNTNGPHEWILPSGTYLASVSSSAGNAGTFSLNSASNGLGGPGCLLRIMLGITATYTGPTLAATDCAFDGPFYFDEFAVLDVRPCTVTVTGAFGMYLELDDAITGDNYDFVDSPSTSAHISIPHCTGTVAANPLLIVVSTNLPSITGSYTVTVDFTAAGTGTNSGLSAIASKVNASAIVRPKVRRRR